MRTFIREALDRGDDPEAVVDMVDYRKFIGDRLSVDKYGMRKRHRNAVQKIIEEELAFSLMDKML